MDSEVPRADGPLQRALAGVVAPIGAVVRNPSLRRVQLALAGSLIGDWAYATAVTVWAFGEGGATAVGVWAATRFVLMAVFAPLAATLVDRWPRRRVMIGADVARAALVVIAAAAIAVDGPAAVVYVAATAVSMLGSVFRPAQAALLPSLAERPEELTASNGVASTLESLAFFVGPAIGAALLSVADVEVVFLLNAATYAWSAALVAGIDAPGNENRPGDEGEADGDDDGGALAEALAGFAEIRRDRRLQVVAVLVSAQTLVAGASTVFTLLLAVEVLDLEPEGVGYLDAILGIGAIAGGVIALSRSARGTLATDLAVGAALWSLPLLLVTVVPGWGAVIVASVVLGVANPLVDVNFATVVQRVAPDRVLGRVFGALEGAFIASMAVGAIAMPVLDHHLGLRTALAVVALVAGIPVVALLPAARRIDDDLRPPEGLDLLRSVPIFAPMSPSALDTVARALDRVEVAAGHVVIREGATSDRFYLIEEGLVAVTKAGDLLRHEGPGEHFGEIGLLRDVPRTATVTAVEPTTLLCLERDDFLDAVSQEAEARSVLDDLVLRRLGR